MKSVTEVAKELGITRQAVLLRIQKGQIKAVKVGSTWVVVKVKK